MARINSLVMEKVQFNHFPSISLWELSVAMANKTNFSYFELPKPEQHLNQIKSRTASVILKELSFKNIFEILC